MKRIHRSFFLAFFIFHFSFFICHASDFGLLVNQYAGTGNEGGAETGFEYRADILPHLSFLLGNSGDLFLSAGITLEKKDGFSCVPELFRTEFSYRPGNLGITVGRMQYADPLGFIASGLFDGVRFSLNSTAGSFNAGAWYTGLM
jgi:hypothetical protein